MENSNKQTILIVDDTSSNIDILRGVLSQDYKIKAVLSGEQAFKIIAKGHPDLILLDIMMPGMDGYEVCRRLKSDMATKKIPVIFLTAKTEVEDETKGFELGAADYITKPISPPVVKARVKSHLFIHDQKAALEKMVKQRTAELHETRFEVIKRLGRAGEYKDNETGLHVIRMSHYSRLIAEGYGMGEDESDVIFNAAQMHDIGKIGIPDKILLKPGKLDNEEWETMKKHTSFGADIIGEHHSDLLTFARNIALTHHEKWNGTGYPSGLKEQEISLEGRIVAIADVFDALTSTRPYKKAWPVEDALNVIKQGKGSHFDPELADVFYEQLPKVLEIKKEFNEA